MRIPWLYVLAAVITGVVLVLYLRKWRQREARSRYEPRLNNQPQVSAGGDDYVGEVKIIHRDVSEEPPSAPVKKNTSKLSAANPDLIVLNLLAKADCPFAGYELLQALLAAGLRFGKMEIFHRYQHISGSGDVLFSIASAVKPGNFELSKMGGFSTPGLVLFMQLSQLHKPAEAFEIMLSTARQLAEDLDGELCDESRVLLTEEKANLLEQQAAAFERKRHTADLFASH